MKLFVAVTSYITQHQSCATIVPKVQKQEIAV
jgi:hypothetical protein